MRRFCQALALTLLASTAVAEQKVVADDVDIHYIVLATMTLDPGVAEKYGLPRAPRKGFINISAVNNQPPYTSLETETTVEVKNLLGQVERIRLREIRELPARYSVGTFSFSPDETIRFRFEVKLPDGRVHVFEHQQQMFVEE